MLTLLRSRPAWRGATACSPRYTISIRQASTAFRPSGIILIDNKDVDPTPNKGRRGGSEQSMAGEADGDAIANSEGAYDASTPKPDDSGKKIEGEKDVNMDRSAASNQPAKHATDGQSKQTTSKGKGGSNPGPSGGSAVRGGNAN